MVNSFSNSKQSQPSQHHQWEGQTYEYTDLKERFIAGQLRTTYIMPLVLSITRIIQDRLHESLKLHNLRPGLYILMQQSVILNTCLLVIKSLAVQWIRSAWSVRQPAKLQWSRECGLSFRSLILVNVKPYKIRTSNYLVSNLCNILQAFVLYSVAVRYLYLTLHLLCYSYSSYLECFIS